MKSDHPNSIICPNSTEFYLESEEARRDTQNLKYTMFLTYEELKINSIIICYCNFRKLAKKLQSESTPVSAKDKCPQKDEVIKLRKEGKCVRVNHGPYKQQTYENCILQLTKKLDKKCHGLGLLKVF